MVGQRIGSSTKSNASVSTFKDIRQPLSGSQSGVKGIHRVSG